MYFPPRETVTNRTESMLALLSFFLSFFSLFVFCFFNSYHDIAVQRRTWLVSPPDSTFIAESDRLQGRLSFLGWLFTAGCEHLERIG